MGKLLTFDGKTVVEISFFTKMSTIWYYVALVSSATWIMLNTTACQINQLPKWLKFAWLILAPV